MDCKHELHPEIIKRIKAGDSDLGQCLRCREAIPLSALEVATKKPAKEEKKNESGSAV